MIPFGVRILWFILTLIGLLGSWVVLWAFGRVIGARWGPLMFCVGNTIVQVTLCLGMIYNMNPLAMPSSFCLAQKLLVSIGTYLMSSTVLVFSLATITAVLKPKTWDNATRALQWKNVYIFPLVLVPLSGTLLYAGLLVKFKPTPHDGMMCDGTSPNWVNLLSPSSIPFVLCAPIVLYQSVLAIKSINKTKLHLFRSRPESGVERVSESIHRKSWSGGIFQPADESRARGMSLMLPFKLARKTWKDKRSQAVTLELEHIGSGDVRRTDMVDEKVVDQSRVSGHGGENVGRMFCIPIAPMSINSRKVAAFKQSHPQLTTLDLDYKPAVSPTVSPSTPHPDDPAGYAKVAPALAGRPSVRYSAVGRTSSKLSILEGEIDVDDISSRVSSSFPVFLNDDALSWRPQISSRSRPTQEIVLEEAEQGDDVQSQQLQGPSEQTALTFKESNIVPDAPMHNAQLVPRDSTSFPDRLSLDGSFHTATENRRTPHQVYTDETDGMNSTAHMQDDWTHVEVDMQTAMDSVLEFRTPGTTSKFTVDQPDSIASSRQSGHENKDPGDLNQLGDSIDLEDDQRPRQHPTSHIHSKSMSSHTKRTPTSMNFSAISGPFKRRREHARLSPAIYTMIIFQFYFTCIQLVAFCSPLRHSVGGNSMSAPYAAHFVAVLLAEWGAIVIFGMLPSVRHSLLPWRPVAGPILSIP